MRAFAVATVAAALLLVLGAPAAAQQDFGPRIVIEKIEIVGNTRTGERIILRALPVQVGDELSAGDRRLRKARYKVLALGFFRDVSLSLAKGSQRGYVVLRVEVIERGTIVLNRLHFGSSEAVPWWLGADLTDTNFLGSGISFGLGGTYAARADIFESRAQWAWEARLADPSFLGTRFGLFGSLTTAHASEPFRITDEVTGDPEAFVAFDYGRRSVRLGPSYDLTPLSALSGGLRVDDVTATDVPAGAGLLEGDSTVTGAFLVLERDTRPNPILPYAGDRLVIAGELAVGDYEFGSVVASYEHWWPVVRSRHVVSLHLLGGVILGDAPRFDRFYAGDLNRLMAPRAHGLVVTTKPAPDLLDTGAGAITYADVAGLGAVEYTYRLFRRTRWVYAGRLYIGAGLLTLAEHDGADDPVVDFMIDAGLRLDTEIGIFELTIGNGLGRLPL